MNVAIITGASSGIGEEFVRQVARQTKIDEIWMIARRRQKLEQIGKTVKKSVKVIAMDLQIKDNIKQLEDMLKKEKPSIGLLVNCAGYGIRKEFSKGSLEEELGMIEVNCISLTALTYLCLPYMQKGGRIIQVASAASFLPQAGFAVYSASKSYVLNFSRALNKELKKSEIYVTAVCPGPVDTDFFLISDKGSKMPSYKKYFMARTDQVVRKAIADSNRKKSISIYGVSIWLLRFLTRFI
ncbi:SDR family NAD(P)-dependent oxidoreductase [Candidatus Galacturonibacter soehngenii]|uniref:SDR family NAD(P)-dependent oxidoreductase n=1 Tax=Candidatus Galacturonatibacter soehngenii TaxID=2307010 RepID=A0A7V7UCC5_9FIRM|nr:SDR family NAD(P)-dependent oxidoreductase [Candidatus Galacturonibacter soehngenii]KAB1439550.1 SDR family NAD(P)-dependent oxidoreductase [Candidatus Galacturonibacter soehngenii]